MAAISHLGPALAALLNADFSSEFDVGAQKRLLAEAAELAASWQSLDAERLRGILRTMVRKVQVHADRVDVTIDQRAAVLWLENKDQLLSAQPNERYEDRQLMVLTIPARLKRAGIGIQMVVDDGSEPARLDGGLIRVLLRAHAIWARVVNEPGITLREIAVEEGATDVRVGSALFGPRSA